MGVPVVILTHEPHHLAPAIDTLKRVTGWGRLVIVDDSGNAEHRAHAVTLCDDLIPVGAEPMRGYSEAMRTVWATARDQRWSRWMLWEQDFRAVTDIDLQDLMDLLDAHPRLTQVCLQRQAGGGVYGDPWYDYEREHASMVEAVAHRFPSQVVMHDGWVEQNRVFSTNPHLADRKCLDVDWPTGANSERRYSQRAADIGHKFAWLGNPGHVVVNHVGEHTGRGY